MDEYWRELNKSGWKMAMDDHIRNFLAQVSKDELVEMWREVREQELDREYGSVGEEMVPAPPRRMGFRAIPLSRLDRKTEQPK